MTAVDVRHAGGTVTVEAGEFLDQEVVRLTFPGFAVPLYPHEARALCIALLEAAHRAEHPTADDWLDNPEAEEATSRTGD